ncbi:MAG: hypothetical protein M0P16_09360 [Syntrophales bacterium]|jgi:hypothetical protein|nr:hypothetical protein [Syntrophales bacterium]MCK9389964.1 hypothetical protein [Syntrophales bacterium]
MENLLREGLRPIDEAKKIATMMEEYTLITKMDDLTGKFAKVPWREWSEDDGSKATLD